MATFHIHEDFPGENAQLKDKNPVRQCLKNKCLEYRAVLQPLCNYQQNAKRSKVGVDKENCVVAIPPSIQSIGDENINLDEDVSDLKPVFRRVTQNSWVITIGSTEKEYEEDVWRYLYELEKKLHVIKPYYMTKQIHLNWEMRSVLIDWLVSVAEEYKMSDHTVHLSVNYLDRFLSNISVIREKFQLVGVAAMMLAGKISEIYPPDSKEWSFLTRNTFTTRQIVKMEQLMLKVLNFEMNPPTTLDFLKHLCAKHKIDKRTMYLAMYFSELALLEGEDYLEHFPSKLAAAALLLARHTLFKSEPWSRKMEETAGYTLKQLSPVVQKQQKTFKSSPLKKQQAVQKKYSTVKYQRVALLKPRILNLDADDEE